MIDYKDSGVDREEGYRTVDSIRKHSSRTMSPAVISGPGGFAALYSLSGYSDPVLVSGTDGVGTKLKVAFEMGIYNTVGIDCVAMCVNDILCHGAKPLFFLDYLACGKLKTEEASAIVEGIADGCGDSGCSLIGGETAEMPGFYTPGEYDIAGFAVGAVEKNKIIDGSSIKEGDVLIGIASSGVHSNGFSLVRTLVSDFHEDFEGNPIGLELLKPTRIYVEPVLKLIEQVNVKGMAHITGGGLYENVPRMFPEGISGRIKKNVIPVPSIFSYLMGRGVDEKEMYSTFNMGIGFTVCVSPGDEAKTLDVLRESGLKAETIGKTEKGDGTVWLE